MRLETLDDIDFSQGGSPTELLQTKHHIGPSTLTVNSVDLWRTLNAWMDLSPEARPVLRLVTTQIADGDVALLREGDGRDPLAALESLLSAATDSENSTSKVWRDRFLELEDDVQISCDPCRWWSRFRTRAGVPIRDDAGQGGRIPWFNKSSWTILALLKGWWAGIAVRLLDRSLSAVTGNDLAVQVADIIDQMRADSLPVDPEVLRRFDESITDGYQDRPFVHQLAWIALENERLWKAIRDYHRAYTQRSFWLRYQLVGEQELDRFAFKLHDEWEQVFDEELARMAGDGRPGEAVGQEILRRVARECRSRLRERFDEPWFNRGMLHALADGELGQLVGWHPEFQTRLEGLLGDVAI
ncbi:MAG: hypothetical protein KY451_02210 [Actinobacteria bacterium]|nr:hypothetical protein [Actinomycetota bacterium]